MWRYSLGQRLVNGKICNGITIIPNNNTDLMVMKLSIGQSDNRIYKAQLTLKREGTVTYYNTYAAATGIIPSSIMFEADFRKFKMPKALEWRHRWSDRETNKAGCQ
jgi:hypothetical protein